MDATLYSSPHRGRAEELDCLAKALGKASGAERELDDFIADIFRVETGDYTASPVKCRGLCSQVLPEWHLSVGYDVSGLLPAATLTEKHSRVYTVAATVPLAILRVLLSAILIEYQGNRPAS